MTNITLPTDYQQFIHLSRYAKWMPTEQRRETWSETVARYLDYFQDRIAKRNRYNITKDEREDLEQAILNTDVMPSMRAMMTAGPALDRDPMAGFNCSYVGVSNVIDFDEIMYILLCGTGVGFSCERQFIANLPVVGETLTRGLYDHSQFTDVDPMELSFYSDGTIYVADSKYGWASALRMLIVEMYNGNTSVQWDTSMVRAAGEPLKTFGGRASGPDPLIELFNFVKELFAHAQGRRLTSIEVHDLVCKIASVVVVGGVRRSALISLSNLSDDRMRHAKSGQWWETEPQRALANNSVSYTEKPDVGIFMEEWLSLYNSKSGERGIFNREASEKKVLENGRRKGGYDWGTNPCSEIVLRSKQCCNLSEVVVKSTDTLDDLKRKARLAAILGTMQASLTDYKYLSDDWSKNNAEEALLGVSMTGIMDNPLTYSGDDLPERLNAIRDAAVQANKEWANKIGINQATAVTAVKPSGTVSQLVNSASGIHARHSNYYIRTVRGDVKDPLTKLMIDEGVPNEPDIHNSSSTVVFSFPVKAPSDAVFRTDMTAIEQLELWLTYQRHYCEHKPSVTISVKEDEWPEVGAWVYNHFDEISGVSFLPFSEHTYQQAPYQDCSKDEYEVALSCMPFVINWARLSEYETRDETTGSQELACTAGGCEL